MAEITLETVRAFYDRHNIEKGDRGWMKRQELLSMSPQFMGRKVLEIGCGTGALAGKLQENHPDYTAIDLSPVSIEKAKKDFPDVKFIVGDFMEYQTDEKFNTIALFDSLEHFADWRKVLAKVIPLLNPRGRILLNIPNPDFTKFCQRSEIFEHIIDNLIWLEDLLVEFKKYHLDLIYYHLYSVETYKQYQFCVFQ